MLRTFRALLAPVAVLLLLGAGACGGDDDDDASGGDTTATVTASAAATTGDDGGGDNADLEAYFSAMEDIATRTNDKLTRIGDRLANATYTSDKDEIADVQAGVQESGQTIETAVLDVSDLDPPASVKDAHDEFRTKLQQVLILESQLLDDIKDIETSAELDSLANTYSDDLNAAQSEFADACFALAAIAEDNSIQADLRCG